MAYYNNSNGGYGNYGRSSQSQGMDANMMFGSKNFDSKWITDGADEAMVDYTQDMGKYMADNGLTKSKIRSIYGEIKRIQMGDFAKEKSSFYLLKPKMAYALGRDDKNEGLKLFKKIFDVASTSVTDQKSYQNFCRFMEALLAYHKAFGGKD